MKSRKLKLVSDGSPEGTQLIDVKSGERISNIREISFSIGPENIAGDMTVKLFWTDIEMEGWFSPKSKSDELSDGGIFFETEKLKGGC